jgi:DNA-binding transcriptional LysR family regulator
MNKLKFMHTFMLTVEEGSITQAARRLGISKAAVSKQLIDLESKLNTQLIHRTTRLLKLTDTGQSFYESIKNVFAAVAEAESVVMQTHDKPTGTLRIASHRHFGERFIIHYLKEFITLYPDLKIDIELADRFPDIEKENFDILCGIVQEGPDHLVRKKIAAIRYIMCASPEFIATYGMPKTPQDLKKLRYITHSFRQPDNVLLFKNNKEISLDYIIRLNDAQAMLTCALQGLGFIKIFNYFVDKYIKNGTLIEILKDYREQPKPLYIFYQQHKFLPNKIRLFIDFLCKKVNEDMSFSQFK